MHLSHMLKKLTLLSSQNGDHFEHSRQACTKQCCVFLSRPILSLFRRIFLRPTKYFLSDAKICISGRCNNLSNIIILFGGKLFLLALRTQLFGLVEGSKTNYSVNVWSFAKQGRTFLSLLHLYPSCIIILVASLSQLHFYHRCISILLA